MNIVLCDGTYQTANGGVIRCEGEVSAVAKDDLLSEMTAAGQISEDGLKSLFAATLDVFVVMAIAVLVLRLLQNR